MGACALLVLLPLLDGATPALALERPHQDVELVVATGEHLELRGFHRALRGNLLHGYRGSAEIEIVWTRIRELDIQPGETPGARMRLTATLDDDARVEAEFDEREGEHRFTGVAAFGRVSLFLRDIRHLRVIRPAREDTAYAVDEAALHPVRARLQDRQGVVTELDRFRRYAGENVLRVRRGALAVAVPLAWIERAELASDMRSPMLALRVGLRGVPDAQLFSLPIPEEKVMYGGQAPFGAFRIPLGDVRVIEVLDVMQADTSPGGAPGEATPAGAKTSDEELPPVELPPVAPPAEEERPPER